MNDLERLMAIEAVRQVKARYFRAIDTKDFEALRQVFAEDAVFDARESRYDPAPGAPPPPDQPVAAGLENIVAFISSALATARSVHHGHTPEIEILSETTARAIVPMEDLVRGVRDGRGYQLHGFGHYRETYVKTADGWRIHTSKLTRLRVDMTYFDPPEA